MSVLRHPTLTDLTLLALATYRLARIIGWDDITIRLRGWVTGVPDRDYDFWVHVLEQELAAGHDPWRSGLRGRVDGPTGKIDRPPVTHARWDLAKLLRCPWCLGFWLSIVVVACWLSWPRGTLFAATPLAVSAIVGLVAKNLDA